MTVEKIAEDGTRYLVIEGKSGQEHHVHIAYLQSIALGYIKPHVIDNLEDFLPKIIEEWLRSYSSVGNSGEIE
jgi:hypothetical protein